MANGDHHPEARLRLALAEEVLITTPHEPGNRIHDPHQPSRPDKPTDHRRHGWMMIACCIPTLVIAIVLVATGVVNSGFLIAAVGCTAMMAIMMRGMGHGDSSMRHP
ncbi:hypothetical protein [Rhodococcus olei]